MTSQPRKDATVSQSSVITVDELGEVWKVEVGRVYVGIDMRQRWGARLYSAGPTGRWRKKGMMVVSHISPTEAARDLLRALDAGKLTR